MYKRQILFRQEIQADDHFILMEWHFEQVREAIAIARQFPFDDSILNHLHDRFQIYYQTYLIYVYDEQLAMLFTAWWSSIEVQRLDIILDQMTRMNQMIMNDASENDYWSVFYE